MVCPEKAHRRGKLRLRRASADSGVVSQITAFRRRQLAEERVSLFLLYHFPAPLGKPFAADFSLLFKGERVCSRKGGRARPNAKGGGLRPCGAEKEGKGHTLLRQLSKKIRARARGGNSSPAHGQGAAAKSGGATAAAAPHGQGQRLRAEARGGGIFDECRKIFSFLLHFFIKSLDYGGFLWYDEKKGAFLHIPVRKRLFEGETQCNMRS